MPKILVVDDDPEAVAMVKTYLANAGYDVETAADGQSALDAASRTRYDMLILDVVMPKVHGLDVCRRVRAERSDVPILFVSGQTDPIDRTLGLELGADDYLCKPFAPQELVARVRAVLRRYSAAADGDSASTLAVGDLVINFDTFSVTHRGAPIKLTATEFRLLACLASNRKRALTRDELADAVWGSPTPGLDQTISTTLSRLRGKIEDDPANPRYILTVRGFGYQFAAE